MPGEGPFKKIERWSRRDVSIACGIVLFGIVVRLWAVICARAFWCDEAMLALNITRRGFTGLLKPLDWNQAAPVGFLLAEKMATHLAGVSEISLRILPFLSGVGVLVLGAMVAGRYLGRFAGLTAILLLASSETLIYYSNELKQYESDAFFFLIFVWTMLRARESNWSWGNAAALAVIGAAALFCSHTIVFAMAGFFLGTLVMDGLPGVFGQWNKWAAIVAAWAAAFAVDYHFFLRPVAANHYLYLHWSTGFPPHPLLGAAAFRWVVRSFYLNGSYALGGDAGKVLAGLLMVCLIGGGVNLWRSKPELLVYLWSPLVLVFLASLAGKFPFEGRLITFFVPGCLITAAAALETTLDLGALWRWTLAGGLAFLPLMSALQRLTVPERREELRQVLKAANVRIHPTDMIYVYDGAWPAFVYYRGILNVRDVDVVHGVEFSDSQFDLYERDVDKLHGRGRVWLITSHVLPEFGGDEDKLLPAPFLRQGHEVDRVRAFGAEAILFAM